AAAKARPVIAELEIASLGARGDGIARGGGAETFVPYTLPEERVRALVSEGRGRVEEILTASPHRVQAPCRHFGDCGGCALQHASENFYLGWKRGLIIEALARAGLKEAPVGEVVRIEPATRRRASFAVKRTADRTVLGFNARASHRIVEIVSCGILRPALFDALPGLKDLAAALPGEWRSFDMSVSLCDNGLDVDVIPPRGLQEPEGATLQNLGAAMRMAGIVRMSIDGQPLLTLTTPFVRFADVPVSLPAGGFLQASVEGEAALAGLVERSATGVRRTLDLFCGAGAFSLPLSKTATVHAVDSDRPAIAALAAAARSSPYRPITTEARNLFERPLMADDLRDYDLVLFDPPRAGAREQAGEIARSRVPAVIGVSCNPATFARDAALLAAGGYALLEVTPVDQFVYSPHVELVGVFAKR
ncbi:MAG: hypothetical protein RIE56_02550, partial [Amphiplicatus sp.]